MGCFNSKDAAAPASWQEHGHSYATYAQPAPAISTHLPEANQYGGYIARVDTQDVLIAPFLNTFCPAGVLWRQHVQSGPCQVDSRGLLAGPWAECIQAAVQFEHHNQWHLLPEYSGEEGPVGGVLACLDQWLSRDMNRGELMEAASRLEEAAHYAEGNGLPLPIDVGFLQTVNAGQITAPSPYIQDAMPPHSSYGTAMQLPSPMPFGEPAGFGPSYYAQEAHYQAGQDFYQSDQPGPTLLQQHEQNQGMSTGAKVALGVAAAGAGVVAGALVASHMDEIGDAAGNVGDWAGEHVEEAEHLLEDMF